MGVLLGVRMLVVAPVLSGPPDGALLQGAAAEESQKELEETACLEGAMRKVTVITGTDAEHPHIVGRDTQENGRCRHGDEEDRNTRQMNGEKRPLLQIGNRRAEEG